MKVLIIEDEQNAASRLITLLQAYNTEIVVLSILDSVRKSAQWLMNNPVPDLIFMDIQLGDGNSFEIFEIVKVECPIIFITAYNEYAIQAFKVNSVDYLLKPLSKDDLYKAIDKYKSNFVSIKSDNVQVINPELIKEILKGYGQSYKNRFIVKVGEHIKSIAVSDILYFFSRDGGTFLQFRERKRFLIDFTMDQLEKQLNPSIFFRINRKFLISHEAIVDIVAYSNSRLKLMLHFEDKEEIIVSREKVGNFKEWLDR